MASSFTTYMDSNYYKPMAASSSATHIDANHCEPMATSFPTHFNSNYCEQCQKLILFVNYEISESKNGGGKAPSGFDLKLHQSADCSLCAQIFEQLSGADLRIILDTLRIDDHVERFIHPLAIESSIEVKLKDPRLARTKWPNMPVELNFWFGDDELPIDISVSYLGE